MKYRVSLGYSHFDFNDASEACMFAGVAKSSYVGDKYDKDLDVSITFMNETETNKEED